METRLSKLKGIYDELYRVMKVHSDREKELNDICDQLIKNRRRYEAIEEETDVPWWWIAAIHNMESGGRFDCHFLNGDSLKKRTVREPKGLPIEDPIHGWSQGYTWEESCICGIEEKGYDDVRDNSLNAWLWRGHRYNGMGNVGYFGRKGMRSYLYTPYLWSGTHIYQKGKFTSDGEYDSESISEQIGIAPIIRELIKRDQEIEDPTNNKAGDFIAPIVIKSVAATFIKLDDVPSNKLDPGDKKFVRSDELIEALEISGLDKGHYKLVTKHTILRKKEVFVYAPHWGIVKGDLPELEEEKPKIQVSAPVQRQIDRINKYVKSGHIFNISGTKVTYYSQRDNYTMGHRTCNSSSNAMYLDWLRRVTGRDSLGGDNKYLTNVLSIGDTIYHWVQTEAIKQFGFNTKWMTDGDLDFVDDLLEYGFPVVCNIRHKGNMSAPKGGHVIVLIGKNGGYQVAHDPYGTLASRYSNTKGAYSKISEKEFQCRWQGGYRILA